MCAQGRSLLPLVMWFQPRSPLISQSLRFSKFPLHADRYPVLARRCCPFHQVLGLNLAQLYKEPLGTTIPPVVSLLLLRIRL